MTEKAALPRRTVFGVGISTSALGDRSEDPALRRAIHEELLEDLAVHGRLVFTSQAHLDLFVEAVSQAADVAGQGVGGGALQPEGAGRASPDRRWTRPSATSSTPA